MRNGARIGDRRLIILEQIVVEGLLDVAVVIAEEHRPLRQHLARAGGSDRGPDVLALLEVLVEPGAFALGGQVVALDHQLDRIDAAALYVRVNQLRTEPLDAPHAALRVVRIAARERTRRDEPAKRIFSEHGGANESKEVAIPEVPDGGRPRRRFSVNEAGDRHATLPTSPHVRRTTIR